MALVRTQKQPGKYFLMHKQPVENDELSWKAKGILAYLMSKPSDWEVRIGDLEKHATDGESALRSGLEELERCGYLVRKREHDPDTGHFQWVHIVHELPTEERSNPDARKLQPSGDSPSVENPQMDNPQMDNRDTTKNDSTKNESTKNYQKKAASAAPAPPAFFPDLFDTSITDIKEMRFARQQWQAILDAEREADGRVTLIDWLDSKLNGAQHPAIQTYRDEMQSYPRRNQYDAIINCVGENGRLDLWRDVVRDWKLHGWNPYNVAGMLDAFERGGIEDRHGGSRSDDPYAEERELYTSSPEKERQADIENARNNNDDVWGKV